MQNLVQYHTKNYDELLSFLKSIPGKHISVQEICAHFSYKEKPMGMTTVYRQLERLVEQGVVQKYNLENGERACFEYIGEGGQVHDKNCFHCKCTKCGKLIHIECEEISRIEKHILDDHDFVIDEAHTVFYGLCKECRKAE